MCVLLLSMVFVANRDVWIVRDEVNNIVCGTLGWAFSHACFCSRGQAPIYWAARGGHSSTVELLIANDADVNARDK